MRDRDIFRVSLRWLMVLACAAGVLCYAEQVPAFTTVSYPTSGNPFAVLVTKDLQYVFVSVTNVGGPNYSTPDSEAGKRHGVVSGLQIFRNINGHLRPLEFIRFGSKGANGMAFLPDDKTIVVAAGDEGLVFVDVDEAIKGTAKPYVLPQGSGAGSWDVAVTPDGKCVFSANEYGHFMLQRGNIGVVALQYDPTGRFLRAHTIRQIPAGNKVPGLTLSPNGSRLYVVREILPHGAVAYFSAKDNPLLTKHDCVQIKGSAPRPNGLITVIDVSRATTVPSGEGSIITEIAGGCSPVRVIESSNGANIYVTARGDNRVLSFDAKLLESDTEHAFLRAYESGGVAPVGLRFLDGEGKLIVANSNRFGDSSGGISIIDLANAAVQHIPSGEFPRNITVAPDRGSAFITNYNARTLEVLTLHPSPGDTLR